MRALETLYPEKISRWKQSSDQTREGKEIDDPSRRTFLEASVLGHTGTVAPKGQAARKVHVSADRNIIGPHIQLFGGCAKQQTMRRHRQRNEEREGDTRWWR